jgi:hypothetical protein
VHPNNIESFWALLKRGIIGTHHRVSAKYLPLYLAGISIPFQQPKEPLYVRACDSRVLQGNYSRISQLF